MNTAVPFQAQKPIFHKLENIADMAKLTREEREYYHISLDSLRTNLAVMDHERNVARAEGRADAQKLAAKNLKAMGILSAEQVSAATGLTIAEIDAI